MNGAMESVDRGGNPLIVGQLVMVPTDDYVPGRGHCYTFSVGTTVELWQDEQGMRGDMATVHMKWETVRVLCNRLVLLG